MAHTQVYEGTLDEITDRYGKELVGLRIKVIVENLTLSHQTVSKYFWETASPKQWVEALEAWASSHSLTAQPLSDEAIDRESIYAGRSE